MEIKTEYQIPGIPREKTPQQRMEASKRRLLELQDYRRLNNLTPLEPRLYMQNYEYDPSSQFAQPIFTDEQKEARSEMVQEVIGFSEGWGELPKPKRSYHENRL